MPPHDLAELVAKAVAFRQEFDDAVILTERHRLVDPQEVSEVPEKDRERFRADAMRFPDVIDRLGALD